MSGVTSQIGLHEIIKEPTHSVGDFSACIDMIFTRQPNLVMEFKDHSSLHPNCHHQLTFAKFNFKIHYPPPYE